MTTTTVEAPDIPDDATFVDLWFGIRNLIFRKLGVPVGADLTKEDGTKIPHPGSVLTPVNLSLSTRHPLFGKVQFVDMGLWRDYWRLKFLAKNCRSKYRPHQGLRETARRRARL